MTTLPKVSKTEIALANDRFRKRLVQDRKHRIVLTQGVSESPDLILLLTCVRIFQDWTPDNDPHGEHDFGSIIVKDTTYFFKIDYYEDETFEYGGDPEAGDVCRVLTIMLSSEY
jgi:hypothetical protein